jgi:hypothetical protein
MSIDGGEEEEQVARCSNAEPLRLQELAGGGYPRWDTEEFLKVETKVACFCDGLWSGNMVLK